MKQNSKYKCTKRNSLKKSLTATRLHHTTKTAKIKKMLILSVNATPLPPHTSHSFLRLHSIYTDSFLNDLKFSQHITNPPDSLDCLLTAVYNSTLNLDLGSGK